MIFNNYVIIQDTSNATSSNPTNRRQKSWDLLDQSALTQAKQQKQYSTHQVCFIC